MVDLHSHILPKMDDGSASPEETAALLDMLWQQGVTTVVATPHFYATKEAPGDFLERRQAAVARMLPVSNSQPQVLLGAEITYFPGIGRCAELIPLQIENTKLLLIEMPYSDWSDSMVEEICQIPAHLGLQPVLAHIDRFPNKKQFAKYRQQLAEGGVLFQCNADAFQGFLNCRKTLHMLEQGYVHFLGSDCHNRAKRAPQLQQAYTAIEKKLGKDYLMEMDAFAMQYLFPEV